jgi:hypothetical protein
MTLGLFEKRIEGDDALMKLAQLRFQQARMGAEMHAATPEQLESVMRFRPATDSPVVVHLPRHLNLSNEENRSEIGQMAAAFAGRIYGMVIHDNPDLAGRGDEFRKGAEAMQSRLAQIRGCPMLFVEYAAGVEPSLFARIFESIGELTHISSCLDVGHLGIQQARKTYRGKRPGEDVCTVKDQPRKIPEVISDVEAATGAALPTVLDLIERLAKPGKPVHFHLHDGHPLSTFSPFGVSDHLSFLIEMPLNFEYRGRRSVPLMFGRSGLQQIVRRAIEAIGRQKVSFTLEIHPGHGQLALGDAAGLFNHWTDKTNAERMNQWLAVLRQNHEALLEALKFDD